VALRWPLLHATVYGDEALHYSEARTLGFLDTNIFWVGPDIPFLPVSFVLGRPLFALLHAPGAWADGFTGFRALGMGYAALLAPLAFETGRRAGAGRPASVAAGLAVACHPAFIIWGARIFPDSLMACLVLAALCSWMAGRSALAALLLVAACWTKESALAVAGSLAGLAILEAARRPRLAGGSVAAVANDRRVRWACAAVILGVAPVVAGYLAYPRFPGWVVGGDLGPALERLWLFSWLVPLSAFALRLPRARPVAFSCIGLAVFYVGYSQLRGGFLQSWYAILPACLAIVCCAVVLDAGLRSLRWPRLVAPPVAAAVGFAFIVAFVGSSGPVALLHPLAPAREAGLAESEAFVKAEHPDLAAAIAFQRSRQPATVLELDVDFLYLDFPFSGSESTSFSYPIFTAPQDVPTDRLVSFAETADLVWLHHHGTPFGKAFLATYGPCEVFAAGGFHAFMMQGCQGRLSELQARFDAAVAEQNGTAAA
jgi:hypothetical protein